MKILLFGAGGQVGHELVRCLAPLGQVTTCIRGPQNSDAHLVCDLSHPDSITRVIEQAKPDLIVNAAAYTAVDAAESDAEAAFQINANAPGVMAQAAAQRDIAMVHYSTDYVFAGTATIPYVETDETDPQGIYGQSKLEGEQRVAASGAAHLIFRTAWVYSVTGHNFVRTMLRLAAERDELTVVDDQRGSPVWARLLAESTASVVSRLSGCDTRNLAAAMAAHSGIYHLSARGETTWCRFAQHLLEKAQGLGLIQHIPDVKPVTTADFPTPARRPAYSVLSNDLIEATFGITVQEWRNGIDLCLADMVTLQ